MQVDERARKSATFVQVSLSYVLPGKERSKSTLQVTSTGVCISLSLSLSLSPWLLSSLSHTKDDAPSVRGNNDEDDAREELMMPLFLINTLHH